MGTFAAEGKSTPRRGAECPFRLMPRRCRGISLPPALRATSLAEGGFGVPRLRARRGDAPQGYLLRCVGIAPYEIIVSPCVNIKGRTESSAPTMGTQYITS